MSLRLYPHNELGAAEVLGELCAQAGLALRSGFDGIMTSEHHGGFAGYLSTPLQVATFVLEENPTGWAAACPLLLPLRSTALLAEEVAWLSIRHPGRVGLGVAVGALPSDFEAAGAPHHDAVDRFRTELPRLADLLRGRTLGLLAGDPALQACASHPVPVLSAAVSAGAARRAAGCGVGILMEGMSPVDRLAALTRAYRESGGSGPVVLIRRVWLGEPHHELIDRQRRAYDSYASTVGFGGDQTLSANDAGALAEQLTDVMERSGADALNLRLHLPGMSPEAIRDQIIGVGSDVLQAMR